MLGDSCFGCAADEGISRTCFPHILYQAGGQILLLAYVLAVDQSFLLQKVQNAVAPASHTTSQCVVGFECDGLLKNLMHECRFKEEAEGAITDLKEHVASAHQDRHALEQQAKDQVRALHVYFTVLPWTYRIFQQPDENVGCCHQQQIVATHSTLQQLLKDMQSRKYRQHALLSLQLQHVSTCKPQLLTDNVL